MDAPLAAVLEAGRELGYLGPGPVDAHVRHAEALAGLLGDFSGRFVDLGSGAGVPGLVLAREWPEARGILIDAAQRRCRFLIEAVDRLELAPRVSVRCGRAEDLARDQELRDAQGLVVARGFGAPAVVAECGVGFVEPGGSLVVTEPPPVATGPGAAHGVAAGMAARWPEDGLELLGLSVVAELRDEIAGVVVLMKHGHTAERWPRRAGVPHKRPLW